MIWLLAILYAVATVLTFLIGLVVFDAPSDEAQKRTGAFTMLHCYAWPILLALAIRTVLTRARATLDG